MLFTQWLNELTDRVLRNRTSKFARKARIVSRNVPTSSEVLENRVVPTITVDLTAGALTVTGTAAANNLTVSANGAGQYTLVSSSDTFAVTDDTATATGNGSGTVQRIKTSDRQRVGHDSIDHGRVGRSSPVQRPPAGHSDARQAGAGIVSGERIDAGKTSADAVLGARETQSARAEAGQRHVIDLRALKNVNAVFTADGAGQSRAQIKRVGTESASE